VHKWRSEEQAIMVGTHTAATDNPQLNNRLWSGKNPARLLIDEHLRLPAYLHLFNQQQKTIVFNQIKQEVSGSLIFHQLNNVYDLREVLNASYTLNIQSIIIEGGAALLQSFINQQLWDEARVITNQSLFIGEGLSAPLLTNFQLVQEEQIFTDSIAYFAKR